MRSSWIKLFYWSLVLLPGLPVFAQEQYRPGKIFTGTDTLTGSVSSQRTARFVRFRTPGGEITEYAPEQVSGFQLADNVYHSKEVEVEAKGERQKEPLFMQLLVQGRANLYYYREKDNSEHYWIEKDGQLHELRVVEKVVEVDGKHYAQTRNEYQGVLGYLLAGCDKIKVEAVPYGRAGLVKAVFTYNSCFQDGEAAITYRKSKIMIHPGIKAGISRPSYGKLVGTAGPSYGVFVNFEHNGGRRVLSTQLEWVHNRYTITDGVEQSSYRASDVAALLRFTYPKGVVRPVFGVGVIRSAVRASTYSLGALRTKSRDVVYKAAAEAGLLVPFRRHFLYVSGRVEPVLDLQIMRSRIYNLSLSVGF